ncbi:hypothetical protein [Ensifer adhaerens]|uniref:Uncharacterized protein n=1 Tax=Ensifer adhaerens TaxID=106592 RepID=A0A9Q8YIA1_ENSAD|nr:hypothetical protein [Ensifer adhaerens]USJ28632.1 hypothetical protein NE863_35835 [Ensifer adhaerens]
MNQNMLLVIAASVGLAAGAGGTYLATSGPDVYSQAIAKAELVSAISADPSLCAVPMVEMPTGEEALAAFRKAHAASPLVCHRNNMPEISLKLGQCDKSDADPSVVCMTSVKMSPQAEPLDRVVGFSKSVTGGWVATIN